MVFISSSGKAPPPPTGPSGAPGMPPISSDIWVMPSAPTSCCIIAAYDSIIT
jgi:hypothetical protein